MSLFSLRKPYYPQPFLKLENKKKTMTKVTKELYSALVSIISNSSSISHKADKNMLEMK